MRIPSPVRALIARVVCLFAILVGLSAQARAFTHPCVPTTLAELDTIKANLDKQPWKSGYEGLLGDWHSLLTYNMGGPFELVSRNPHINLTHWRNDMVAIYNMARLWYFTGNEAYAQKAHDILIAWATVNKTYTGQESGLDLGDYAIAYAGGASILRGTWPGWTAADTATVKNWFGNVLWAGSSAQYHTLGPANKGALCMASGLALATFCDDTEKFNFLIDQFRASASSGLRNTLPIGEMGETGRDAGHAYGDLKSKTLIAEIAWKQGIDLYGEMDNRLLAVGEYYARNTYIFDNPFVPYGTIDWTYYENAEGPYNAARDAFYMLQNAYKNRKGLPTPWIDRKMEQQGVDGGNFMFAKTADFTTATPPAPLNVPSVSLASSGLTLTTLGTQTVGRDASYDNGVWTVTGLGNGVWSDTADDCQFVYTTMTGNCAMIARVTSCSDAGAASRAGLMIRDNLTATVSKRCWVSLMPGSPSKIEVHMRGWTQHWGGSNRDDRSIVHPPGMPYWLKVERRGNMISTYSSPDGTSWAVMLQSWYDSLPSALNVGLFTNSGNSTPITATFDHVAFTGGTGGLVTTPAAPAAMFATGSSKAVTLRWLESFDATAYDVLRSTTSGGGYTLVAGDLAANKTSYVDTGVTPGTTYYYVARAKNSAGVSGNSPEFYASLLPSPMVNLATTGTATDDQNLTPSNPNSASAFDQNPGSLWFHGGGTTGWLQYDFGAGNAQVIKRYTVNSANLIPERDPKDWQFLASHDGVNWTTLDTRSGQTFALRMELKPYDLSNTTAYRFYRFKVTANNGHPDILHLGDIGLWGDSGRTLPDGTYVLANHNTNQVADLASGATAAGTALVQSSWTAADTQKWQLSWQGNGLYRATNVATNASGAKVIDNGGSSSAGDGLAIQPASGATSQLWTVLPDSDGFYRFTSANGGLVMDVAAGSTANGANIIQATYTGGDSQLWMPGFAVTPQAVPPAPTGLTAAPASISRIDLSWTASPGAISYNIKRADSLAGPYTTVASGVNITSHSDAGLSASTTYYYVVSAVNGSGESADSAPATATTLASPPDAPTGLSTVLGHNQVTLTWTVSGGATSYTVKRATTIGGPYTTVADGVTSATYTDTGLTNGVTYHYVIAAVNIHGSSPDSTAVAVTPSTLVAHLKFDETGGATATDSSGRAFHATLLGGPTFSPGVFGNTLDLPATAAQHARLPSGVTSGLTDFTISTWIKVNAFANWQRIFDFGSGTTNYMFLTTQYAGSTAKLRFGIRTPSILEQNVSGTAIALTTGAWTHVAVVRSGTTVSLYVNGALAGSGTIALSPSDLGVTTQNYLGKSQFNDPYLNAALDDFRLYSHAMDASEISAFAHPAAGAPMQLAVSPGDAQATLAWLPNATTTYTVKRSTTSGGPYATVATGLTALTYTDTGLTNDLTYYYVVNGANDLGSGPDSAEVAVTPSTLRVHLKFDEIAGTVAADSGVYARHATLVGAPTFAAGKLNNALGLTAASAQYATLPSGIVSGVTDFTVSTWVKVNAFATWQRIFDFGTGTTNYMFLTTQYGTGGSASRLRFGIRTPSVPEQIVSGTSIALTTGAWTHVAVVRSGTTVSLYVNGALAGSGTIALNPSDLGVTTQNYLGKSQWNDPYLDGALDDFRLYSQALSASEIALYASPLAAPQNLAATPGPLSLDLSWNAVPNATRYTVKYSTVSGGPYSTLSSGLPATTQLHSGLGYGTTYYYVVSAANSVYEGPVSAELAATPDSALLSEAESATPAFEIIPASEGNPATARLTTATSVAGHSYQLQTCTDLASGSWFEVGDPVDGTGEPLVFETPYDPAEPRRFYRILVSR